MGTLNQGLGVKASGGSGGGDTNTWRPVTAGGNSLTGAPSGETLAFTEGTNVTIAEDAGAVTINATDTDENIANTDLTLDGDHTTDVGANTLTFDSGGDDILKIVGGATDLIKIGPSGADYTMPADRGTNQYVLQTNGAGAASWQPEIERLSWQAYNNGLESTNLFFAQPMTDNKYRALCDTDYGATAIGEDTTLTITQLLRGGYYVADRACQVRSIVGWGTSNNGEVCTIIIVKFTPEGRASEPLAPVTCATAAFTGESNNNISSALVEDIADISIAAGDILMPMVKTAAIEESAAIFFNLTFTLY